MAAATAVISPIVDTATEVVKNLNGFSRKHRDRRDSYYREKHRLLDRIADARKSGDGLMADEDEDILFTLRDRTHTALKEYQEAIDEQADTPWTHPLHKLKKRRMVKRKEREVRSSNEALRDYEEMISSGSDISSIYAASGSPPESRESIMKVEDWFEGLYQAQADGEHSESHNLSPLDDNPGNRPGEGSPYPPGASHGPSSYGPPPVSPVFSKKTAFRGKRKRPDAAQLKILTETYNRTAFPSTEERLELAKALDMTPRGVQIWFQHKRQSMRQRQMRQSSATQGYCR